MWFDDDCNCAGDVFDRRVALSVTRDPAEVQPTVKVATAAGLVVLESARVGESVPSVWVSSPRLIAPVKLESPAKVEPQRGATKPLRLTWPVTVCAPADCAESPPSRIAAVA